MLSRFGPADPLDSSLAWGVDDLGRTSREVLRLRAGVEMERVIKIGIYDVWAWLDHGVPPFKGTGLNSGLVLLHEYVVTGIR